MPLVLEMNTIDKIKKDGMNPQNKKLGFSQSDSYLISKNNSSKNEPVLRLNFSLGQIKVK